MTSDWIDSSYGHSLDRGRWVRQLWVVTAEQGWKIPILMLPILAMDEWVNRLNEDAMLMLDLSTV